MQLAQAAFEAGHAGLKQHPGLIMPVQNSEDVTCKKLNANAQMLSWVLLQIPSFVQWVASLRTVRDRHRERNIDFVHPLCVGEVNEGRIHNEISV